MSARHVYSSKQLGFISFLKDFGSRPRICEVDMVFAAQPRSIENAIRCEGLAPKKAVYIKNIMSRLQNERDRLPFEYLCGLLVEEKNVAKPKAKAKVASPDDGSPLRFSGSSYRNQN
ncbi:hypothetical protein YC2023_041770 [Brassica napus]